MLSDLVPCTPQPDSDRTPQLRQRLLKLTGAEKDRAFLELVKTHTAIVLGQTNPAEIDVRQPFRDLGFDSLTAIELRNSLGQAIGIDLPATLVFDHPTPAQAAAFICLQSSPPAPSPMTQVRAELAKLESAVAALFSEQGAESGEGQEIASRMRALFEQWTMPKGELAKVLQATTDDDELFTLLEKKFDLS
jgi:acyl carrier protein